MALFQDFLISLFVITWNLTWYFFPPQISSVISVHQPSLTSTLQKGNVSQESKLTWQTTVFVWQQTCESLFFFHFSFSLKMDESCCCNLSNNAQAFLLGTLINGLQIWPALFSGVIFNLWLIGVFQSGFLQKLEFKHV